MTKEELQNILYGERTNIFAVLDGASIERLPLKLWEMRPPSHCLIPGDLEPDVAETAPYLVGVIPGTDFANWLTSDFLGKHWGIFAHSRHSILEMRKHFTALFTVYDHEGTPLLFRYFDPRVIQRFLPTCNLGELKTFFGKVDTFFSESETGLLRFRVGPTGLEKKELKGGVN